MKRLLVVLTLLLAACAPQEPREKLNPAPSSSMTRVEANQLWQLVTLMKPGLTYGGVQPTGSMVPLLDSRSVLLYEPYTGQPLHKGDVVVFDRGDHSNVLHSVYEVREDAVFITGLNNQYSDGWFPKTKIKRRLVGILYTSGN